MNEGHIKFLHVVGPDTKNSFGIMQQIHATQDMREHRFLITAYESCKQRFPKLKQFPDNLYIPEHCGFPKRLRRIAFFCGTCGMPTSSSGTACSSLHKNTFGFCLLSHP